LATESLPAGSEEWSYIYDNLNRLMTGTSTAGYYAGADELVLRPLRQLSQSDCGRRTRPSGGTAGSAIARVAAVALELLNHQPVG
jgi:hypothetical protein